MFIYYKSVDYFSQFFFGMITRKIGLKISVIKRSIVRETRVKRLLNGFD